MFSSQSDDEGEKSKIITERQIDETGGRRIMWAKSCMLFLVFVVFIGQAIAHFTTTTFNYKDSSISVLRRGPLVNGTPAPSITFLQEINVATVFVFANLFAALGYVFSIFFAKSELTFIARGVNPYLWVSLIFGYVPLFLAVELTAGIVSWTELFELGMLIGGVLFITWLGTFINSYSYIDVSRQSRASFSWAYLVMGGLLFLGIQIPLYVNAGAKVSNGGPTVHLAPVIAHTILMLTIPAILIASHAEWLFARAEWRDLAIQVASGAICIIVSSLGLLAFAVDGITVP